MKKNKIIICKGNANTPQRFWDWAVCPEEEFTEKMKGDGWIKSQTKTYLNPEQLDYVNEVN